MKIILHWYRLKFDTVTLEQIRQFLDGQGVITIPYKKHLGELWKQEEIHALKEEVEAAGLRIAVIESVKVSDVFRSNGSGTRIKRQ